MYVCPSVTANFKSILFSVSRRNRAIFWPSVLHDPLFRKLFFDFDLGPLTTKIWHKIAYRPKSACMAYRPEMFGPNRGLSGMTDPITFCISARRDQLTSCFFHKILQPTSCLHHLIPPRRDNSQTAKLRKPTVYDVPFARTNKFKNSFILYALSN